MEEVRPGPPADDCTAVEVDGCFSVHCGRTQEVQFLNQTASAVWRLLDGTRTIDDVVTELAATFRAERGTLTRDVVRLVQQFERAGMLTRRS